MAKVKRVAKKAPVSALAADKKFRVRIPEDGTLMTYETGVLGGRRKFMRGKVYIVDLEDAKKLNREEVLPGRKVFKITEIIPELEGELLGEEEEAEDDLPSDAEPEVEEIDLTKGKAAADEDGE